MSEEFIFNEADPFLAYKRLLMGTRRPKIRARYPPRFSVPRHFIVDTFGVFGHPMNGWPRDVPSESNGRRDEEELYRRHYYRPLRVVGSGNPMQLMRRVLERLPTRWSGRGTVSAKAAVSASRYYTWSTGQRMKACEFGDGEYTRTAPTSFGLAPRNQRTLAKWARAGSVIVTVCLTSGAAGSNDSTTADKRTPELQPGSIAKEV